MGILRQHHSAHIKSTNIRETYMIRSLRSPLALALLLALAACQQQSTPPAATSAPVKPAATAAPLATADSVGVPECDDYLNKYQACVDSKVPEAARGALKQSLDQTRAAWRTAAANPGGREGLAMACKQAREASKASMSAYGCTDL
jgi:hypothetical protein